MTVIAKWTEPDGSLAAQVFPSWAAANDWMTSGGCRGIHGVSIEEMPEATPLEFQGDSQDDEWEDD